MIRKIFSFFKTLFVGRELHDVLFETKKIRIKGIIFIIKRIDPHDFLSGHMVMRQVYDEYKIKSDDKVLNNNLKKIREHMSHVLVAGTVKPKLSLKDVPGHINVSEVFKDPSIADKLFEEINLFTYGKKKL